MGEYLYLINCPPGWIRTPPLSLEFIRTYLTSQGFRVKTLDLNIITYHLLGEKNNLWLPLNRNFEITLFDKIKQKYPYLYQIIFQQIKDASGVGFSLFHRNKSFVFSLIEEIKQRFPNKPIFLGGPQTLFMKLWKEEFAPQFSWVIGEGEKGILSILTKRKHLVEYEEITELDSLPFLEFPTFYPSLYKGWIPFLSSRGCIRRCRFCTERLLYRTFRQHSPEYIVELIKHLKNKFSLNNFVFQDSTLNTNLLWLDKFCNLLLTKQLKINWEAQFMIRKDFPLYLAKLMKESGCVNLFIGLESGSDKVLEAMEKGFYTDTAIKFFSTLRRVSLHFEVSLIFGYPQEEENDFKKTINFIVKNKKIIPKIAQINPFVNYFSKEKEINHQGLKRCYEFFKLIQRENIRYTKSFINNLIYRE